MVRRFIHIITARTRKALSLSCICACGFLASCASSDAPDAPADSAGSGKGVDLHFSIAAGSGPTRSPGVWDEDAASRAELYLNPRDMRVLVFDQSGQLLKSVAPAALEFKEGISGDGYYNLRVAFSHEYFDRFAETDYIGFQVMLLANLEGAGGRYSDFKEISTHVGDVRESFAMPADYYPGADNGIPMYGHKSLYLPKQQLLQGPDAPVMAEIDMIRSLCKIEVRDRVVNASIGPDGKRYPYVTSVELTSWADNAYLRPAADDYSLGLRQANIHPAPVTSRVKRANPADGLFRLYVPEVRTADIGFRVSAVLRPGEQEEQFDVSLAGFAAGIGEELVRNHVYRFDVHAFTTKADLTAEVSQWTAVVDEFEIDDLVSVEPDGFLAWSFSGSDFSVSTERYNGKDEKQLSFLNGTDSHATGRFRLESPRGATWYAYFIPGENGVDAFEFVDVDAAGNVIPDSGAVYATGIVGDQAVIHIRGKGPADSYRHWAELVVEVRTVDGNVLYAPLTPAMSPHFIIYRENRM